MGWVPQVMAVLAVIERMIPLVERFLPKHGAGPEKAVLVQMTAQTTMEQLLTPGTAQDPEVQAAMRVKIDADVALANLLQRKGAPVGGLAVVPTQD